MQSAVGAVRSETIRENAKACLDLFSQYILIPTQCDASDAQRGLKDEFGRFKLWTSNIGVFAELQSSLDFRLREFSDIKEPFLRQLATIESRLLQFNDDVPQTQSGGFMDDEGEGEGEHEHEHEHEHDEEHEHEHDEEHEHEHDEEHDSASSKSRTSFLFRDWDKTQLLQSIHQSIDWLHRLSNLVRKASFANQNKRGDRFKLEDADKNDLAKLLTKYYAKLVKREFNGLQDSLIQRLATSMVTRRRRIMYRQSQQRHWKLLQVEYTAKRLEPSPQPHPHIISGPMTSIQKHIVPLKSERAVRLVETKISARYHHTATTLDANIHRKLSAPSGISKGSTAPMDKKSEVLVPPPPMAAKSGEDFICEYCCLILRSEIALNKNSWADHVQKDLYPYVCVVEKCNEPTEIYSSSKEWLAHMRARHLMRWHCVAKPHTIPFVFEHEVEFIEHMKTEHAGKFRDDQLKIVAESSSHSKDPTFDDCPFCNETSTNLEDHVGQHLRNLAMKSLPWPEDDIQGSQRGSYLINESSGSDAGTRDTISNSRSELPEPEFDDSSEVEDGSEVEEGQRLRSYGHFQEIAHQHRPLDLLDQLIDKPLANLAQHQHPEKDIASIVIRIRLRRKFQDAISKVKREQRQYKWMCPFDHCPYHVHMDINQFSAHIHHHRHMRRQLRAYCFAVLFMVSLKIAPGHTYISGQEGPLRLLPYAFEAPFNSYHRQHDPYCLPDTRVDVLREISDWADGQDERNIFWLNGMAGTGKSTIARTIARDSFQRKRLGASFFFSRGRGDIGHAGKFCTSLAVQLANNVTPLQRYICDAITECSDIASQSLRAQWNQLILRPLSKLDADSHPSHYILVIDALDECNSDIDIQVILQLLAQARSLKPIQLRIFVTSRPQAPIRYGFHQIQENSHQDFVLHDISPEIIDHDIFIFLEDNLRLLGRERGLGSSWPGKLVIQRLVEKASRLFIWAATAYRFIREGRQAQTRLLTLLDHNTSILTPETHLNEIYLTCLRTAISSSSTKQEQQHMCSILRTVLGSIIILSSPLSVESLSLLLRVPRKDIDQTLDNLHAVLDVPENQAHPLRLHHPSFRDFLLSRDRCGDLKFWVDEKQAHKLLAEMCIQLMSETLKQDVFGVHTPGFLMTNVGSNQLEQCLPPEVQYTCLYWFEHFKKSGAQLYDDDQVHQFLQEYLLYWCEALGWMRKASEAILAITSIESDVAASQCPNLCIFVLDAKRFIMYNRWIIENAPLQLYCSALIFAPNKSVVRAVYQQCIPVWLHMAGIIQDNWSSMLQTLEGHANYVNAIAFSPDGRLLASASDDRTVRLWDAVTGAAIQTLEGHTGSVSAVIFSPDGGTLASSSHDMTVRLWDAVTGEAIQTLEGHANYVNAIAFSPDGRLLASASDDRTVRLWDAVTGAAIQTLEGHTDCVSAATFSPDGRRLASASDDMTVRLWDVATTAAIQTLEGHIGYVNAVAFSPDGRLLASASDDRTVRLWDAVTGAAIQTLEGHTDCVSAVIFSPDGRTLASSSSSYDRTVRLWDAVTGVALQTLEGHTDFVSAVTFSPDGRTLASASYDRTIRLWDAATGVALQTLEGHTDFVSAVTFSPDGRTLASASYDRTIRLWDAATRAAIQTLEGHSDSVGAIALSPDCRLLASASDDRTVRLWDAVTGVAIQTLEGHTDCVSAVTFSPDGRRLASASEDMTISLWDAATGAVIQTLEGHTNCVNAVAISPDGQLLASASEDGIIRLWDTFTRAVMQTLEGHTGSVSAVAFSPDGRRLASSSYDMTVRLWDSTTGAALQRLELNVIIESLSFSVDASYLETDKGMVDVASLRPTVISPQPYPQLTISVKERWIVRGVENVLWLPPDYRPTSTAINGNTLVLGHRSGGISILKFGF